MSSSYVPAFPKTLHLESGQGNSVCAAPLTTIWTPVSSVPVAADVTVTSSALAGAQGGMMHSDSLQETTANTHAASAVRHIALKPWCFKSLTTNIDDHGQACGWAIR